jgi:WD40 repeat protein
VDTGKLVLSTYQNVPSIFDSAKLLNSEITADESIVRLLFVKRGIVAALGRKTLYFIDPSTNMVLKQCALLEEDSENRFGPLSIFVAHPNGKSVTLSVSATDLEVRSLIDGSRLATLVGHKSQLSYAAISPDGRQVAAAAEDLSIRVWSLEAGSEPLILKGQVNSTKGLAYAADSVHLMSYGDQTARIWDARPDYLRFAVPIEASNPDSIVRNAKPMV